LDTEQIIQNVKTGNIRFGYTNPYQSSTGLNFLMSFLDKHTVEEFAEFQRNIGVVAQTTLQLTSGSLDAWVSESQVFYDKEWDKSYKFVPFGVRHDEPLYKCNPISSDFDELVEALVNPKEESDYSFGYFNDYVGNTHSMTVKDALGAYSENKTGGRPVVAVFVCDTSGSMAGDRIYNLRRSLKAALPYITDKCSIGLVEFNSTINVSVPLARADADHKAKLRGAIGNMVDGGGTALWDAVLVAEDIIQNHVSANPGSVPKIFVLTDGDATEGYYYDKVKETLEGLSIPIYTFGYETNNGDISDVASLNEASYSNVDVNNVIYVISNFFKAEV
jgi:Ca-activated chloride channel family protein